MKTLIYNIGYYLCKFIAVTLFRYRIVHPERMIEKGGVILAVNHTSYLDPPLVAICSHRAIHFLARKTLFKWPILGPLFPSMNVIPVDRDGANGMALRAVIQRIRQGDAVVLFPEGTRARNGISQIPQAGIGFIIAKTLCPVLPLRIFGTNMLLPFRRRHGVFLPVKITTVIGEAIHFLPEDTQPANKKTYQRLSQRVMEAINSLRLSNQQ